MTEEQKPSPILYMPKLYRLLMELKRVGHVDDAHIQMISSDIEQVISQTEDRINQTWKRKIKKLKLVKAPRSFDVGTVTINCKSYMLNSDGVAFKLMQDLIKEHNLRIDALLSESTKGEKKECLHPNACMKEASLNRAFCPDCKKIIESTKENT